MVGTLLEPSCGRRRSPIHSILYSIADLCSFLERNVKNYYFYIIRGEFSGFDTKKYSGGIDLINIGILADGAATAYQDTVSDSINFEKIKFKFPESWNRYTKTLYSETEAP